MQTPALFQPMNLGAGFDGFGEGEGDFFTQYVTGSNVFPVDYGLDLSLPDSTNIASDFPLNLPENVASVDANGDVNANGQRVISADAITNIALGNPGREGEAIAQTLKNIAPNWTSQFKDADSLVKAAYNLFNTSKAVIQGKPIPQSIQSPYVYNPNNPGAYNPNV